MKNVEELRAELASVIADLRNGGIKAAVAAEITNAAGKMIASAKVELEHSVARKEAPNIAFLKSSSLEAE